jgi:hypothetical protein
MHAIYRSFFFCFAIALLGISPGLAQSPDFTFCTELTTKRVGSTTKAKERKAEIEICKNYVDAVKDYFTSLKNAKTALPKAPSKPGPDIVTVTKALVDPSRDGTSGCDAIPKVKTACDGKQNCSFMFDIGDFCGQTSREITPRVEIEYLCAAKWLRNPVVSGGNDGRVTRKFSRTGVKIEVNLFCAPAPAS